MVPTKAEIFNKYRLRDVEYDVEPVNTGVVPARWVVAFRSPGNPLATFDDARPLANDLRAAGYVELAEKIDRAIETVRRYSK
jgi:hypothetical protein